MNLIATVILLVWAGLFVDPSPLASLQVQIHQARSDRGKILILVFDRAEGFPDQIEKAFKRLFVNPKNGKAELSLDDIPAGKYAITVLHDEDDNGVMNTNLLGLPEEKYGFSNNPKSYFGPPSFEKSAIQMGTENRTIQINLR